MGVPRIDFYVLPDHQEKGRSLLACRLADKAYSLGHTVYLFASSEARAAALDDLLWTFRQDSFIPHERYPLIGAEGSPVLIGTWPRRRKWPRKC
jgi:DNA polymerase-3 subunit chi